MFAFRMPQSIQDVLPTPQEADTLAAEVDTTAGGLEELSQSMNETGELIASGQWDEMFSRLYDGMASAAASFFPRLLSALVMFFLFYLAFRMLRNLLVKVMKRSEFFEAGLQSLLLKTFSVVAWVLISVMVLGQFGFNITALLAGLSVIGVAVGFAAQDTLQNFISGLTILVDQPFKVGHYIEVDDTYGQVVEITLRSTRVRTLDNQLMVMPNNDMINSKLINHTVLGGLRVSVAFGIGYSEDPEAARKIALGLLDGDERLNPAYKPDVVVAGLNDSSVDMVLRMHLRDASTASGVVAEYTEKILKALNDADIEIPFPHMQLLIDEAKAFQGTQLLAPAQ